MSEQATLLIEIGVEELPAGSVLPLSEHLGTELLKSLDDAGLNPGALTVFATPRRIAASITQVSSVQPDQDVQRRGPAVSAAFDDDGLPTKALAGFARSCGVDVDALERQSTDKGEWMVYSARQVGQTVSEIVAAQLPQIIKTMPMPKRMRWADRPDEFLRPVLWVLALHGTEVVPLTILGHQSDRITSGHRFHASDAISIATADSYESRLQSDGYVIADFAKRRELIQTQVQEAAVAAGGQAHIDDALLDEVCALVEWPVSIAGSFDRTFLEIPKEALIQTMEENQRYFALLDKAGDLLPGFITVANIESSNPATVREGNERVIRPRFSDTMFFWNNDKQKKLLDFRDGLNKVLFQEKLGSVHAKTERLEKLAAYIAPQIDAAPDEAGLAARLCRCDLMSDIVNELPKMQGIAGRYYAEREGYSKEVVAALEEQYFPKNAGGALPESRVGLVLAIAEKVDTLTGIFGIGMKPTGAKDPFALRRASLGLLRILIEKSLDLDVRALIDQAAALYGDQLNADFDRGELTDYVLERLRGFYQDQGEQPDVVEAVLAKGITHPLDFDQRVKAIAEFRESDAAESLAAASKRIRNLLKKTEVAAGQSVDASLLTESAEKALADAVAETASEIQPHYDAGNYAQAMQATSRLKEPVDAFFDGVMVMVDDEGTRDNRLALLQQVSDLCSGTAELSRLQVANPA